MAVFNDAQGRSDSEGSKQSPCLWVVVAGCKDEKEEVQEEAKEETKDEAEEAEAKEHEVATVLARKKSREERERIGFHEDKDHAAPPEITTEGSHFARYAAVKGGK